MTASSSGRIGPLLKAVRRRVRALLVLRAAARGAALGLGGALLVLLVTRIFAFAGADRTALALVLGATAVAALAAAVRRLPLARVAALVDERAGLKERVTTALEIEASAERSPFAEPILRQAEAACAGVRAATIAPAALPRDLRLVAAGLLLCLAAGAIPPLGARSDARDDAPAAVDPITARRLEKRARMLVDDARAVRDADAERLGRQMEALARDLEKRRLGRREALARITDQKERLEREAESRSARRDLKTRLEDSALKEVLKAAERGDEEAARKEAERLAAKLLGDDPAATAEDLDRARDEFQGLARAAKADPSLQEKTRDCRDALAQGAKAGERPEGQKDEARKAARDRLSGAMRRLAEAAGQPEGEKGGEVPPEGLAGAFESLEQARARISGGEPRPAPESMRRPERQEARKRTQSRTGERAPREQQAGSKPQSGGGQQASQQQRRTHPDGSTCSGPGCGQCGRDGQGGQGQERQGGGQIAGGEEGLGTDEQISGRSGGKPGFEEGRGGGGSDAGWGTTNLDAGPGSEAPADRKFARRTADREPDTRADYRRIYAPRKTDVTGKDEATPFQVGEGPSLGSVEVRGVPDPESKRYVPYDQAPRPSRSATERSLERSPVPREYRDAVRRYFDDEE